MDGQTTLLLSHEIEGSDVVPMAHAESAFSYTALSRRDVRSLMFHLLYSLEVRDYEDTVDLVIENFNQGFDLDIPKDSEVKTMVEAIVNSRDSLDALYIPFLDNWRFERISVSTRLILRLAIWELVNTQTDTSIIINEAVELSKCFAEHDAYRFINGILDSVAHQLGRVILPLPQEVG
jgi:N utilization substance protein B